MTNYQARLERLEAAIAPEDQVIVLVVKDGQTNEDSLAEYAEAHGLKATDINVPVVYLSESESVL